MQEREGNTERTTFSDLQPEESKTKTYWFLFVSNISIPIVSGIFDIVYYMNPSNAGLQWTFTLLVDVVGILQIISGIILTVAVLAIRKFLIDNDHSEVINVQQMLIHAGAFSLYLVAEAAYYGTWMLRVSRTSNVLEYA